MTRTSCYGQFRVIVEICDRGCRSGNSPFGVLRVFCPSPAPSRCRLLLLCQVEIPPPRPAARASILQALIRGLGASAPGGELGGPRNVYHQEREREEEGEEEEQDEGIDWEYLSSKTEGCQARDLAKLVKR